MISDTPPYPRLLENAAGSKSHSRHGEELLEDVVRGQTLTEQVYLQLKQGLLLGVWRPGDKITARKVSRTLGISLTPAREAIIRLSNEGAIDVSEKRTFSIPKLDAARYKEITHIRVLLEPEAAELATERVDSGFADALEKLNERMRQCIVTEAFDDALRLDSEFHLTIYDAAQAPILCRIINSLWLQVGPTRNRLSPEYRKQLTGYANHQRIIEAIRNKNGKGAAEALRADLLGGASAILAVLG